jgi:membrane fusion protein, multidrug efflux system
MLSHRIFPILFAALALGACEKEQTTQDSQPTVRAIKHMMLDQRAGLQQRRIAGLVAASISTNVGFEINGQVIELLRKAGEPVEKDELIGRLDPEPSRLRLAQSQNSVAQAQATLDDARKKFDQQRKLKRQGYVTQAEFDTAEAALKNAEGAVGVAESQLDLARRDLAKTDLKAPFSGVIARLDVDVFQEVSGGQTIYAIQTEGQDKIKASLPETLINRISLASRVEVMFPPLNGASVRGVVDEIAPLTGAANAYPIEVRLEQTPPGLRSGMSAELVFRFETESTGKAFLVPMTALRPKVGADDASVFVFDPATNSLIERTVRATNVENNSLEVIGDLKAGEIIATAGVSFLHDGMKVSLFDASSFK